MLSYHGQKRARKRLGIGYEKANNHFEKAKVYGKYVDDYKYRSAEYDYLLSKQRKKDNQVVVYNGILYVFDDDTCITMFGIPPWFGRKKHYEGKLQVRNMKAYMRHYDLYGSAFESV